MNIFYSLLISLALTLVLELLFAFVWGVRGKDLLLAVLVNILTNPFVVLLNFICTVYTALPPWLMKAVPEVLAVMAEWIIYRRFSQGIKKPLLFSVSVNAFSFFGGVLINILVRNII